MRIRGVAVAGRSKWLGVYMEGHLENGVGDTLQEGRV